MKKIRVVVITSAALWLTGCVSTRTMQVSASSPVRPTYEQGTAVLKSQQTNGVVVRLLTNEFSNETNALPAFYVATANGGTTTFDFSTVNINAYSGDRRVGVYTFEELQTRIRHEAAAMAFALALSAASQSMAAAMPQTTYSSGTVSAYGTGGYAQANYSGFSTTYNPAATALAQSRINAQMMGQMSMVASARDIQLNDLGSILRRNTVAPGQFAGGVVKLHAEQIKAGQPLRLLISVSGEKHEFLFDIGS